MKDILLLFLFISGSLTAKEGMWIPLLLEKYNLAEMQEMGFRLTAQDIYDINHASMKDAVVVFGGGCTGEMISPDGLLITNHHCGYGQIQSHSTLENDYLTDGFWAMSRKEELPNPGLTVRFLEYMKEVTGDVLDGTGTLTGEELEKKIRMNMDSLEKEASASGKFLAQVKPLFYGNQYYLYVYKVFRDVRLVGAPPSSVGKFGGDTDNWMWPRHTGDFSLFRVYADKNNEPAGYSPDNIPYTPKTYFPVSLEGVHPEDFVLVLGNPGSTMQYIPSQEVEIIMNQRDPDRISIRGKKLEIMDAAMSSDPQIRIQYAAKYASVSNAWKKWQGEIKGLERLNAVTRKEAFEDEFTSWAKRNKMWESNYRQVFGEFDSLYHIYRDYIRAYDYYSETVFRGAELFRLASFLYEVPVSIETGQDKRLEIQLTYALEQLTPFFKNYHQSTDEKLFAELLGMLYNDLSPEFLPGYFTGLMEKHQPEKLIRKVFRKSVLAHEQKLRELLESGDKKKLAKLRKDPLVELYSRLNFHYKTVISPVVDSVTDRLNENKKQYMAGIMKMKAGEPLYPDANLTLRVAYGRVEGYEPYNGVRYKHYTTLDGIMEKEDPEFYDYTVPERLKELHRIHDYGRYGNSGSMPVCFTASVHTTGGNSGSPVINDRGHLVGVNFDRCWEGTMSDIMYDPQRSRNIILDIRYALFIIDKFAGAGYLLDEMELAGEKVQAVTP
jgi:hypothetical protein